MGLFNTGITPNRGGQLLFRDARTFRFRKLEIVDTFLVEKTGEQITKGWKHFYKTLFAFPGYRNIPSGLYTLSYERDIILDPYNIVDRAEKPDTYKQKGNNKQGPDNPIVSWLKDVGHARRFKIMAQRGKNSHGDKIIYFMGAALIIELLMLFVMWAMNRGG